MKLAEIAVDPAQRPHVSGWRTHSKRPVPCACVQTVPDYPKNLSGICYYIWTDIFFGDVGNGRMNQFVPQLILGNALDGTSGPPDYKPHWGHHETWMFGAHYFFEHVNGSGAAYGTLFPAFVGETLYTSFVQHPIGTNGDFGWTLTMGAMNDSSRTSTVVADKPCKQAKAPATETRPGRFFHRHIPLDEIAFRVLASHFLTGLISAA